MENKIKIMDTNLSNKIAAGEVIESLMNVVKELVENSIDAESSSIKIDLVASGTNSITVTDDGVGMTKEDAINCLKRHATSKLYTDDDLLSISTLGFRGEALPSIASVSKMSIETSNEEEGTFILIEGGDIKDISSSHLRKGTKIEVKDIFYNTPARLKYMKSLQYELANISLYVGKMALSYPNIKFVLTNDGKTLLNTDGSGNLLKVISKVYGVEVAKKMVKINASNSDYDVSGYISYPEVNRSSKGFITLFINNRYIKSSAITKSVLEAYHTYLMVGRSPIVILNIETDPSIIDINVHPTKMEVKLSKEEELKKLIEDTISKALKNLVLVPEIKESDKVVTNIDKVTTINTDIDFKDEKEVTQPEYEEVSFDLNIEEEEYGYKEDNKDTKEDILDINPVAILKKTFIVGENKNGMHLIDQHALHERINYEKIKKEMSKESSEKIDLLVPIKLEFSKDEYIKLKEKEDILIDLGLVFEEFGSNTIIIRSHPNWIKKDFAEEIIRKMIEIVLENNIFSKEKFIDKVAATAACRASIKAGDFITLEEAKELLKEIVKCDNPYHCPHGRPVIINYSYYELEKLFKRVV